MSVSSPGGTGMSKLSRKSGLAKAIHYALERWTALLVFVDDGGIEMGRVEMWRGGLGTAYLLPVLSFPVSH